MEQPKRPFYDRILVTTDFSKVSEGAFRYAKDEALRSGAEVTVLHVQRAIEFAGLLREYLPSEQRIENLLTRSRDEALAAIHSLIGKHFEGVKAKAAVIDMSEGVAQSICQYVEQENIGLVVSARYGHGMLARAVLGSVVERVIRAGVCPVLVVPPLLGAEAKGLPFKRIVFATDFSSTSAAAMPLARYESVTSEAELIVVHAVERLFAPELLYTPGVPMPADAEGIQARYETGLERRLEEVVRQIALPNCHRKLLERTFSVSNSVVAYAESIDADLIVMGTHGSGLRANLIGAVAERVLRHTERAVLVVPLKRG
jgi:nucleotide-binding universal stress UspA family protein